MCKFGDLISVNATLKACQLTMKCRLSPLCLIYLYFAHVTEPGTRDIYIYHNANLQYKEM